ncbi:hypothetical protein [Sphaerochaeta pleomorpha]|uniref:hypothetical protein n=1 Tax=Sphaerochaeta pleomorpha TaxID=1131707 RepID=UPI000304060C|nr:hypothetical protein [Sphaerochaeta pleomorpha]
MLVLFVFPFLADLLVHYLFHGQEHGEGEYSRPEILLEGGFQLEAVLQQVVGILFGPPLKPQKILSCVRCHW